MGLFDLAAPVLSFLDRGLAMALPDFVRLVLWAILTTGLCFLLYRRLTLGAWKNDGDKKPSIEILPLVIATLPALFIITWVSNNFEYQVPETGSKVKFEIHSMVTTDVGGLKSPPMPRVDKFEKAWPLRSGRLVFRDTGSSTGASLPASPAVRVVEKKNWRNALFGNPVGYIPKDFAIEKMMFDVQPRRMISSASYWISNWKLWFVLAMTLSWFGFRRIFPGPKTKRPET